MGSYGWKSSNMKLFAMHSSRDLICHKETKAEKEQFIDNPLDNTVMQ